MIAFAFPLGCFSEVRRLRSFSCIVGRGSSSRHVPIPQRRLNVSMPEEQLNRSQVETFGEQQQAAWCFRSCQCGVDVGELLAVHAAGGAGGRALACRPNDSATLE